MNNVIVVGGGAAGLMASLTAAQCGATVTLLEKMPDVGKKILITGKGRCNLTNSCPIADFIKNFPVNGPFLYSAFNAFSNSDLVELIHGLGVATKVERGGRIFPVSDRALDVVTAFAKAIGKAGVSVRTAQPVDSLIIRDGQIIGVKTRQGDNWSAEAVIVATGGLSYPGTGSTGDGYRFARQAGHTLVETRPGLVPLTSSADWLPDVMGLSLKNVKASVRIGGKKMAEDFGEMLFAHFGLSGPIILSLSSEVVPHLNRKSGTDAVVEINLKPALSPETLDKRIQRDFQQFSRKQLKNALGELLPQKLIPVVIRLSEIDPEKPVHQITKSERTKLAERLQCLPVAITGTRPISEAVITSGGVSVKEISPRTMESKLVRGLYFAGEIIDVDGYTGGFNLQAAFSTGYLAGKSAAEIA